MRIAVLASEFPVLSETPFLNQITGLVRRGHDVAIFAERPQPGVASHPDVDLLGLTSNYEYAAHLQSYWISFRGRRVLDSPGLLHSLRRQHVRISRQQPSAVLLLQHGERIA